MLHQHHVACNCRQNEPIGSAGCICVIIPKRELLELQERQQIQAPMPHMDKKTLGRIAVKLCELKGLDPYEQIREDSRSNNDEMHFDCLETTARWATFIPKIKEYCQIAEAIEMIKKEQNAFKD